MLTKEGVEALLQVKAQKLAEPESLDMGTWIEHNTCGTVSCIAGQIVINKFAADGEIDIKQIEQKLRGAGYAKTASKILGFSGDEDDEHGVCEVCNDLFLKTHWPNRFYYPYVKAHESSPERAEILGQVIDNFIERHYKSEGGEEDA